MRKRGFTAPAASLLAVGIGIALAGGIGGAQAPAAGDESFTPPRTPWGDPDLQGIWSTGYIETPVERPDEFGGREYLEEDDIIGEWERLSAQQDHSTGGARPATPREGDTGTYNTVFRRARARGHSHPADVPDHRPAGSEDPLEAGVREQVDAEVTLTAGVRGRFRQEGTDGPEDRPNDRCRGMILPHRFGTWESGGGHHRIVQSPGAVTIYYEYGPHGGAYRTIPLDGSPHLPPHVRQWAGRCTRPLGRRYARRRHDELHRQDQLRGGARQPAADRTVPACRTGLHPVSRHRRG